MAAFPLPVIRRNPNATEVFTSQEQLEAQHQADQLRHEETLREQEKLREQERKQNAENLKQQKKLFNDSLRTGLFGKLEFAFKQRDKLLGNTIDALKDAVSDRIFGKKISDKESEAEGQVRTTIIERILTNEKYKDPKAIIEPEPDPEPIAPPPQIEEPEEKPKKKPRKPKKSEEVQLGDNVIQFPKTIDIEKNKDAEKNQTPIFKKIYGALDRISKSLTKYFKDASAAEKERKRLEGTQNLIDATAKPKGFIEEAKETASGISIPIIAGIGAIMTTITGIVSAAIAGTVAFITRAVPIVALATGLYSKIKDGIAGWFAAEAWGVSKLSGMIGGLLGGLDEGVWGAIKNGGKWALVGAGIGSFVPVIGTLFGGLIGAALGALLGYFGGEKIAKLVDSFVGYMTEKWEQIKGFFEDTKQVAIKYAEMFVDFGKDLLDFDFEEMKKTFKDSVYKLYESAKDWVKNLFSLDYWTGAQDEINRTKSLEVIGPDGKVSNVEVEVKPLSDEHAQVIADQTSAIGALTDSFDKYLDTQKKGLAREAAIENIYERTIENHTTNNNSSPNYSRTSNTTVTSGSNNSARINISTPPSVRNAESSAWGSQSSFHSGRFSFGR